MRRSGELSTPLRATGNPVTPFRVIPALNRYDVHGCTNVAVIWISKSDPVNTRHSREDGNPVNIRHHHSFLDLVPPFSGVYLFFVRTKEKVRKESRPRYRGLRLPSQLHDFLRSRLHAFLAWSRSFELPCPNDLKIIHLLGTI